MASAEPTWMNADLFEKILRNETNETNELIKVSNLIVKPAVAKGDNYLSNMYRVQVTFSRDHKSEKLVEAYFIVKILPHGDYLEDMLKEAEYFATEISMMSITLPRMNQLLDEAGMKALSAQCYRIQEEAPVYLVFEDLSQKSFSIVDRQVGLDLDHCLIALRNLGIFHASSVALREKDPQAVTKYWRGIVNEIQPASWTVYFHATTKNLGEVVAKWPELSSRISEKIIKLADHTCRKAAEAALLRESDFNVLNHGDFHVNNMMFSHDKQGKPTDMVFVDFQMNRYGSPAIDLLYFFGASPNDSVREHKREFLLREYHASLSSTMEKLKCSTKAPRLDELQQMMRERAFYEVMSSICLMPLLLVDKKDAKRFAEQMQPDGTWDNPGYRSKQYRKVLTRLLPLYDSLGLLDI